MKWPNIIKIAEDLKKYVEKNKQIPGKIDGLQFKEYSYLLVCGVINPGQPVTLNSLLRTAPKPTGDNVSIKASKAEYTKMAKEVKEFMKSNVRLPNYVVSSKKKVDIRLAIYGFAKIIVFNKNEKRLPKTCEFNSSAFKSSSKSSSKTKYTTKGGKVCQQLANIAKMDINNYKDVYAAMKKFSYEFYTNDVKPRAKTLKDLAGNCVDLNQIEYDALKELKVDVQIVRGVVRCSNGKDYGHVWCRIKIGGKWVHADASAAAKGMSMGNLICSKLIEITNINPSWAVSDDGRT